MAARTKSKVHPKYKRRYRVTNWPAYELLAQVHDGPIHLVVDSTGLKIVGDGEWHAYKHKTGNTRRSWRKLHLGVDGDGFIVASKLTGSSVDDASVGVTILNQLGGAIHRFTSDGAYDTRAVDQALAASGTTDVRSVTPPRRTASIS